MAGNWRSSAVVAVALVLAPAASRAQLVETSVEPIVSDGYWSATAGRISGNGNSVLQAEAGWPGIGFTWLKGLDERSDVGLHVAFNYGLDSAGSNSQTGFVTLIGLAYDAR
jgi:hypothetical protein